MAAAHVASAAIRRLQHDIKHKAGMHQSDLCDKDDKRVDGLFSVVSEDLDNTPSASGVSPPKVLPHTSCSSGDHAQRIFEPVMSSTPNRKGAQNGSYRSEQPFVSSSSSSTTDTESINSPSSGSVSGILPCSMPSSSSSSGPPSFRAPILGYEILEQRAKFTVFKIHVQHIPTRESWFVFRRYTDFIRLHRKLRGLFPMKQFSLPPKRWFKDNFEPSFLEGRIQGLQTFVNNILSHKEICESHHVRDFFCFDDPPGPNDCLAESRLRCETLEELVCNLRLELTEKQAEIDVIKAELALTKVQRDTVLKSLRLECAIVNRGLQLLGDNMIVQRLHHINNIIVKNMEQTRASNSHVNLTELPTSPKRQHSSEKEGEQPWKTSDSTANRDLYFTALQSSRENFNAEGLVSHDENRQNAGGSGKCKGDQNSFNDSLLYRNLKFEDSGTAYSEKRAGGVIEIETSSSSTDNNGNPTICKSSGIRMQTLVKH